MLKNTLKKILTVKSCAASCKGVVTVVDKIFRVNTFHGISENAVQHVAQLNLIHN